jgi:fructose 1,6-bisphosphatase
MFDARHIIENATVYQETMPHDNRKFGTRYYGKDKTLVIDRAQTAVKAIDPYRHPHASATYLRGGYWNVEVMWYSLD